MNRIYRESETLELKKSTAELIAEMFHVVHFIEKWGRGIKLILSREPKTVFKEVGRQFIVVFKRKVTPQATPQANLTELENKIIKEITKNARISRKQLSIKLDISSDTAKEYLERLKKKGILKRKGRTSAGYWEIIKK